jgi:hypothetical protein
MKHNTEDKWEREFDEQFVAKAVRQDDNLCTYQLFKDGKTVAGVKDFIRTRFTYTATLREEIEKMETIQTYGREAVWIRKHDLLALLNNKV